MTRESGSAGLHGLADGFGFGFGQMALGVGAPKLAGELVQTGCSAGAGGCFEELIGEHGSPFREPACQGGRSGNATPSPFKRAVDANQVFGEDRRCHTDDFSPALPGHRPASSGGFRVSGSLRLRISAESQRLKAAQETRESDSRQRFVMRASGQSGEEVVDLGLLI
jgi:hypothetical protein